LALIDSSRRLISKKLFCPIAHPRFQPCRHKNGIRFARVWPAVFFEVPSRVLIPLR
jgi:hypothetical protein